MRQVTQEMYGVSDPAGDCLRAAVASLLDLDPRAVPHFGLFADWPAAMRLWANGVGLRLFSRAADQLADCPTERCVLWGNTGRHAVVTHAVVGDRTGACVWDPHPSRAGLTVVRGWLAFTPMTDGTVVP